MTPLERTLWLLLLIGLLISIGFLLRRVLEERGWRWAKRGLLAAGALVLIAAVPAYFV